MAQIETTGGGFLDSGDRRVIRKVYVSTEGQLVSIPETEQGFPLSNVSVSEEAAGIRRAVAEYSQGGEGGASYNAYGKRIELTGGSREVPIQTHPAFNSLTEADLAEVLTRIENPANDLWFTTATNGQPFSETQQLLYNFLRKKVEYVLAPSIVGRVSEVESSLPSLSPIAKVANPSELNAPPKTFWVCTAITANPIGTRYEVTREYTLFFSEWDDVETLYGWT
jgi:hypothetical protein